MLKLILGKDWTENRKQILQRIALDVEQRQPGRILIVPELISHETERRLCAAAGDTASRYAEVLSFTRLSRRVSEYCGCNPGSCLDGGGRIIAMAAAARQLHSKLKAYAAMETRPDFLLQLVDAVDEFKRCRITPADLKAASERSEGSLAQKLEELSLLLEAYDALCQRGRRDPRDQMTWLLEQLEDSDFGQNHVFYIDGFPDFTRQHLAILEHLICTSSCVTVSLNCDVPGSKRMAFEKAGSTASELIRCAKRANVEVSIETVSAPAGVLSPVYEGLFQGDLTSAPDVKTAVTVGQAESVYSECSAAAERICKLVRSGCRYRDIAVVCADPSGYLNTVSLVFGRYGIPLYRSGTEDVLHSNIIGSVICALSTALGGFAQRDVLRYLKSPLAGLEEDICDRTENYAIVWGIQGKDWLKPWQFHPEGLGKNWTGDAVGMLDQLNRARRQVVEPLEHLRQGFAGARNLGQQVMALYAYLEEICLYRILDRMASELEAVGDHRGAQVLNQLWDILVSALEQMYDVLGSTVWEDENFARLLSLLLSQYDVGTIPPVLDAVTVGPVSAMRCQEQKHLIVLGASEGNLPGYGGSRGVLTDQERVALRNLGVPLTGGAMDGVQEEFSAIFGIFCGARESVYVSRSTGLASFVCRRLALLAGGEVSLSYGMGSGIANESDAAAGLARWGAEEEAWQLGLGRHYRDISSRRGHTLGSIGRDHVQNLYGSTLNLSASQVDRQALCRLSYFLQYGLRADERREITIDPAEYGTYVHAVLEKTASRVMELGGFHRVSLEKTVELAMEYSQQYADQRFGQIESQRVRYLFQRNVQELGQVVEELWQELHESRFVPADFETAFGFGRSLPAIPVPGSSMPARLVGKIDRVDTWSSLGRNYFRVVDYKTGKKGFDYCDVFNGIGLQMLLYLFALEQGGQSVVGENPFPAGVQYFPARVDLISADGRLDDDAVKKERNKQWKRKGLLLNDEQVLDAMEPGENKDRLCCKKNKAGTITGDVASPEQMKTLRSYIFRKVGKMVDEIASGTVDPDPYTRGTSFSACTYCPYGAVCHKEHVEGRRDYEAMSAQRFWTEVYKEMNSHG